MNNQLTTINIKALDISKPAQFAQFVAQAKAMQNLLEECWTTVEQQMLDRSVDRLEGPWGSVGFEEAKLLVITDAELLDPLLVKPALNTKMVHSYHQLMGELPAGVAIRTITKFAKRIKK